MHPQYNFITADSDIALIELDQPVTLNDHVKPIPITFKEPVVGDKLLVSGWGSENSKYVGIHMMLTTATALDNFRSPINASIKSAVSGTGIASKF